MKSKNHSPPLHWESDIKHWGDPLKTLSFFVIELICCNLSSTQRNFTSSFFDQTISYHYFSALDIKIRHETRVSHPRGALRVTVEPLVNRASRSSSFFVNMGTVFWRLEKTLGSGPPMYPKWCFFIKGFRESLTAKKKKMKFEAVKMLSIEAQTQVLTPETRVHS